MIFRKLLTGQHKNNKPGAGIVLLKSFNGQDKILVLLKDSGIFDIPKGHCDPVDQNAFSTAQRECFEETQIFVTRNDLLLNDQYYDDGMTIFCARTKKDPVIKTNPVTGELEHIDFYWMNPSSAIKVLPDYLSNAVGWYLKHAVNT